MTRRTRRADWRRAVPIAAMASAPVGAGAQSLELASFLGALERCVSATSQMSDAPFADLQNITGTVPCELCRRPDTRVFAMPSLAAPLVAHLPDYSPDTELDAGVCMVDLKGPEAVPVDPDSPMARQAGQQLLAWLDARVAAGELIELERPEALQPRVMDGAFLRASGLWRVCPADETHRAVDIRIGFDVKATGFAASHPLAASPCQAPMS